MIRRHTCFALLSTTLLMGACATQPVASGPALQSPASVAPATPTVPPLPQPTGQTAWGTTLYDIPADPAIRYGTLPNGMKYAIQRNTTPKDSASVRMLFDFGSVGEAEDERGLAHFIEHMAFNGSTNVPEGEMVKILERKGLSFGADTNASTGFDQTIYKLDLPQTTDDLIDTALMLMRETAGNLTLNPEAIDRERGVLLSERRTRDNFGLRRIVDYLGFVAPDAPFANRLPIGTDEVLTGASAETIRSLYERYYRPEKATLVMVGDFDPDAVEAKIKARFSDWQGVGPAGAALPMGTVDLNRGTLVDTFVDPAVPSIVTLNSFQPYRQRPETVAENRQVLLEALGSAIVNRRIEQIANRPDSPILGGGVSLDDFFDTARTSAINLTANDGQWREGLAIADAERRRAISYGFTEAELAEQLANFELAFRTAAEQAGTRRSSTIADTIVASVEDEEIVPTPAFSLQLFQQLKPTMTTDAVADAFRARWTGSPPLIHVSTKTPIEGGEAAVLAAYRAAEATAVAAPAAASAATFAYEDFGAPGAIVADTTIADLGIRTVRFANNVRLNIKRTDFEQGKVRYAVRVGSGELQLPADQPGLGFLMNQSFANAGLGRQSFDELRQVLAGRDVTPGLTVGADSFGASGTTTPADLPLQMKVTAAFVTDPGFRPEAQSRWEGLVPLISSQLQATPQAVAARDVPRLLASGDGRFGLPDEATMRARSLGELKTALTPALANAPIEIAIVGDIDPDAAIAAVAQSFGALPERQASFGDFADRRAVRFPADRSPVTLTHSGQADQALAMAYWPTDDDADPVEEARVDLLSDVMGLMLLEEIREKLGATYSPSASSSLSSVYTDYGVFGTSVIVEPGRADEVFAAVDRIAGELRTTPVDADLLDRARAPILERIAKNRRENAWWLGVAGRAQSEADRLDRVRALEATVRAITPADLQAMARKYLRDDRELKVRVVSDKLASAQ